MMENQEKLILIGLANRNRQMFEWLFKEYHAPLFRFAESYVCCPDLAEDIVQEVFIKLWENPTSHISRSLRAYLFFMVRNSCIDYLRSVKVEDKNRTKLMEAQILSDSVDIEMDESFIDRIKIVINELPDQCRQVYQMSVFDGLKHTEIAEELGISESAVKVQIFRAKKHLQKRLLHLREFLILFTGYYLFFL
jgi:RNA polymerase sigma-70 factor (family 1)